VAPSFEEHLNNIWVWACACRPFTSFWPDICDDSDFSSAISFRINNFFILVYFLVYNSDYFFN
jgi:hypothetical protein